jgi:hypothetical protein
MDARQAMVKTMDYGEDPPTRQVSGHAKLVWRQP